MARTFLLLGSVFAFLAVALGAFGAHALKKSLTADQLAIYQTGVQYQAIHALALLIVGILAIVLKEPGKLKIAGWLFAIGIAIFSGSLYALAISGEKWLGAITPLGGVCFLVGWGCVIWSAASLREYSSSS